MDPEQIVAELEENAEDLETDANPQGTIALARVSEEIAWTFGAILVLVEESRHLQFLIPEKLKGVGTIPLTSMTSLAARTARDKRPELINKFNLVPHASVFEGVPLGRGRGEQIHRIMSAPIAVEGRVMGVVQVSRKGRSAEEAGAEFSQDDLRGLVALSNVLGRLVKTCSR